VSSRPQTAADNPAMRIFTGLDHPGLAPACALTIGSFDGVHRGHQAMLALLRSEAQHRNLPSCVLTFEPHPRDFFARRVGRPEEAPRRVATFRDKMAELHRCGIDQVVMLSFEPRLAALAAEAFIESVLLKGLGARYVLVGDDFRFGARRVGDYALLDAAGQAHGFDVARMLSYEVHGLRVSSSAVRDALAAGDMPRAAQLLGRPYSISGRVIHGRKLGRQLGARNASDGQPGDDGFRTLNLAFRHPRPAAMGIFAVRTHGLADGPIDGVASLGVRPTVENTGRVLLEVHCFDWPATLGTEGGYGRLVRVDLLHKLRDEARYDGLDALTQAIANDVANARRLLSGVTPSAVHAVPVAHAAAGRQTTRDRIQGA
jgi:riboflavin kinase / FMN adenylyltransferase